MGRKAGFPDLVARPSGLFSAPGVGKMTGNMNGTLFGVNEAEWHELRHQRTRRIEEQTFERYLKTLVKIDLATTVSGARDVFRWTELER